MGHTLGRVTDSASALPQGAVFPAPGIPASPTGPSAYGCGRYAPSPSGDLHLGNLRTAVLAWLFAKHSGRGFVVRIDDIDAQRSSEKAATRQLEDLAALGLTWEPPVATQQGTVAEYQRALDELAARGLVYECYCSRKDIQEAARAPHAAPGAYPGTCRDLSEAKREQRRAQLASHGRVPALRLRSEASRWTVREAFSTISSDLDGQGGEGGQREYSPKAWTGVVDDFVLRRGGIATQVSSTDFAYNLAVVVDDYLAGVDQVVRGDDLLSSAPRQAYLAHVLGFPPVEYVHVPLVLGPTGKRLAKRDGAVTLRQLVPEGSLAECAEVALQWIAESIGQPGARDLGELADGFDPAALPRTPCTWQSTDLRS